MQNYLIPFNPSTLIRFALPKSESVTIKIYNIIVQGAKTLVNDQKPAGTYSLRWNSDNHFGQQVSKGTCLYRVVA
ncbi:MAG: hypothetical protein WB996_02855 [Ignavibacteriaceae bacterium]